MTTLIVDYGRGNIQSVCRAIEQCGGEFILSSNPADLEKADRVILPGVGAFGDCANQLDQMDFIPAITDFVQSGKPFLGICVGMQILHTASEEFGDHQGLGYLPGKVRAIPNTDSGGKPHKIPHIGWASLEKPKGKGENYWDGTIMENVPDKAAVYFVHSFTAHPDNPEHRLADAYYNGRLIAAAVIHNNITGVQFHPEKSGTIGLRVISSFLKQEPHNV